MPKDYSIQGTSKLQREKYVNDALALSAFDAPEPSAETMSLLQDYIEGRHEISDVLRQTIERYKVTR